MKFHKKPQARTPSWWWSIPTNMRREYLHPYRVRQLNHGPIWSHWVLWVDVLWERSEAIIGNKRQEYFLSQLLSYQSHCESLAWMIGTAIGFYANSCLGVLPFWLQQLFHTVLDHFPRFFHGDHGATKVWRGEGTKSTWPTRQRNLVSLLILGLDSQEVSDKVHDNADDVQGCKMWATAWHGGLATRSCGAKKNWGLCRVFQDIICISLYKCILYIYIYLLSLWLYYARLHYDILT